MKDENMLDGPGSRKSEANIMTGQVEEVAAHSSPEQTRGRQARRNLDNSNTTQTKD